MNETTPYPFITEIRKVKPRIIRFRPFLFRITYNSYSDIRLYKNNLEAYLNRFHHRLIFLPKNFRIKENRTAHIIFLNELLTTIQLDVKAKHNELILQKFQDCNKLKSEKLEIIKDENTKLCNMLSIQNDYIEKGILTLDMIAQKEQILLPKQNLAFLLDSKFKTNQTNEVLSLIFKVFFNVLTDENYNKKDLSKLLSNYFETRNTNSPSEKKLYQYFTQFSPEAKAKVKDLFFQITVNIKDL